MRKLNAMLTPLILLILATTTRNSHRAIAQPAATFRSPTALSSTSMRSTSSPTACATA